MKKLTIVFAVIICIFSTATVYGANVVTTKTARTTNEAENTIVQSETMSQLVEIKNKEKKTLEDYKVAYGSETYGLTAYILSRVQVYSIPFCSILFNICLAKSSYSQFSFSRDINKSSPVGV